MKKVLKFFPEKLYGFVERPGGGEAYFHQEHFHPGRWADVGPLPGEPVDAWFSEDGKRATRVERKEAPSLCFGSVVSFDSKGGWGFIRAEGGEYFLHRSEVLRGLLPAAGQRVRFYSGRKNGQPRACYVSLE